MSIQVSKNLKGDTWIISRKKNGFIKQINVTFDEVQVLHKRLGDVLKGKL